MQKFICFVVDQLVREIVLLIDILFLKVCYCCSGDSDFQLLTLASRKIVLSREWIGGKRGLE